MSYSSRIPQFNARLAAVLDGAAREAAELVAENAQQRVPVNTGKLRDAIHVERAGLGEWMVVAGDDEAFYGHIVEHGGARMPAHPFLIPAGEESRAKAVALAAAALKALT